MSDVTRILSQIDSGDPAAAEQLLSLVYDELRKLAAAKLASEQRKVRAGQTGQIVPVHAQISSSYGATTIQDNDAAPSIMINNLSKNGGNNRHDTPFVFTVSLSSSGGKWIYVDFRTENGTATLLDGDYDAASGTVVIAPGWLSGTLTVSVNGDKKKESNETFFVNLTGAIDGTITDDQGVGNILNDDGGSGGGKGKPTSTSLALLADDTSMTTRRRR